MEICLVSNMGININQPTIRSRITEDELGSTWGAIFGVIFGVEKTRIMRDFNLHRLGYTTYNYSEIIHLLVELHPQVLLMTDRGWIAINTPMNSKPTSTMRWDYLEN